MAHCAPCAMYSGLFFKFCGPSYTKFWENMHCYSICKKICSKTFRNLHFRCNHTRSDVIAIRCSKKFNMGAQMHSFQYAIASTVGLVVYALYRFWRAQTFSTTCTSLDYLWYPYVNRHGSKSHCLGARFGWGMGFQGAEAETPKASRG